MKEDIFSIKILVVDDFSLTRKMQIQALNEAGFTEIIAADDGDSGFNYLEKDPDVGLIISDWNMPRMNGYEFLQKLREDTRFKNIPFIMATAQGERSQAQKALESGANRFITKPFTAQELKSVIEDVFRSVSQPDTSTHAGSPLKKIIDVAHIQITDHLILGVLKHLIDSKELKPRYFDLNPICMPGWNPVQNALETGKVDAAFILAPLAMDLFSHGAPVKMLLLTHKNGSTCVSSHRTAEDIPLHDLFKSKTFYLPHTMSIHHMLSDMFLREIGLKLGPVGAQGVDVFFEVVPPVNMPDFLAQNSDSCGFTVAEPFGTQSVQAGIGDLMFLSGDLWENHPCCVLAVQDEFIRANENAAYEFVRMLVQAGRYVADHPDTAARIAADFLDPSHTLKLDHNLLYGILSQPSGIRTDDLFPVTDDFEKMQRYMKERMNIGNLIDLDKFIDLRFAEPACKVTPQHTQFSKIRGAQHIVTDIIRRSQNASPPGPFSKREGGDGARTAPAKQQRFDVTENQSTITFALSSELILVDKVIQYTKGFMKRLGFKAFSGFNLIIRELLVNAVEHGNQNDPSKKITCSIAHMRDSLFKLTVADQGNGFDYTRMNMNIPKDTAQIRKRGYPFIYAFSEKIEFNENGNQITVYHNTFKETDFETHTYGDWCVIRPSGDITASVTKKFGAILKKFVQEGQQKFRFDLSSVKEIDSVGLSSFIVLNKLLTGQGGGNPELEIVNADPEIANLFKMTNLDKAYRIATRQ